MTNEQKLSYCTQTYGDCDLCPLVSYNMDCKNMPVDWPKARKEKAYQEKFGQSLIASAWRVLHAKGE